MEGETEPVETTTETTEDLQSQIDAEVQKRTAELENNNKQLFERAKKAEEALKAPKPKGNLDVGDYIDISASLDGLDQREKEFLASQHKLSGKPIKEIRDSEDFQFWQSSYQTKREKERALVPNEGSPEEDKPKSLLERLKGASIAEKEKILSEGGYYKSPRPRAQERVHIGPESLR